MRVEGVASRHSKMIQNPAPKNRCTLRSKDPLGRQKRAAEGCTLGRAWTRWEDQRAAEGCALMKTTLTVIGSPFSEENSFFVPE
ncbi:hypothetical protein RM69_02955, partial [Mesotoga sp. SC_NapDC3]